jgi:hypothetical protein
MECTFSNAGAACCPTRGEPSGSCAISTGSLGSSTRAGTLLFGPDAGRPTPEGVTSAALGVLYRLGDLELLGEFLCLRESWRREAGRAARDGRLDNLELLLAGLCERLGVPLPEGLRSLDPQIASLTFG